MSLRAIGRGVLGLGVMFSAPCDPAFAACNLTKIVELPVTMVARRPMAPVKINGVEMPLMIGSGGFISTLSFKTANELKLPQLRSKRVLNVGGIISQSQLTTVDTLTLSDQVLHDVQFVITPGGGRGAIGQNLLGMADAEYDFAHGAVRLFKAQDCASSNMAYWVKDEDYSVMTIDWQHERNPHTISNAQVNGVAVTVSFDTGSPSSALSLKAAQRIGLKVDGPGARYTGLIRGAGPEAVKTWIVPVESFKIGKEEIRNTQLRVIDQAGPGLTPEMTIGADFFMSHRVFVANSQHQLYFTYNGGPVFRLDEPAPEPASSK